MFVTNLRTIRPKCLVFNILVRNKSTLFDVMKLKETVTKATTDTVTDIKTYGNMTPNELTKSVKESIRKYDKSNVDIAKEVVNHAIARDSTNLTTSKGDIAKMVLVSGLNLGIGLDVIEFLNSKISENSDRNEQLKMLNMLINQSAMSEKTISEIIKSNTKYPELNQLLKQVKIK